MIPSVLKNFNLFIQGKGKAGIADEVTLPKLTLKTSEHQAGGMDAPIDIEQGMEKLTSDFTLSQFDVDSLKLFGLVDGASMPFKFKGAVSGDAGRVVPVECSMRGLITELDMGSAKVGDKTQIKYSISLRYYKLIIDGEVIHEIDIENMVRIIGGVDQLKAERVALGVQ